jgi:hypothetical protein
MRAGCYPLRRQQQRRTGPSVCSRFDRPVRRIGHAVRLVPLGFVIGEQKGHAQTGNIERGRVISCAIPQAGRIATTEPRSPFHRLLAVSRGWGAIRFGRPMTMGAGMCCPARLDLTRSHAQEMAFILEHPPELASHRRIVAPVPKAPPHASTAPFGFERG